MTTKEKVNNAVRFERILKQTNALIAKLEAQTGCRHTEKSLRKALEYLAAASTDFDEEVLMKDVGSMKLVNLVKEYV